MFHALHRDDPTTSARSPRCGRPGRDDRARAIAAAALPDWPAVTATVEVVSGGITNALLRLRTLDGQTVLVRGYGPNTEVVIDRARENRTFARLSAAGFAPPYLARFEDGRVEGDLVGFRPLEPHEMGADRWRPGIARRLAELHRHPPETDTPRTFQTLHEWMTAAQACVFQGAAAEAHRALDLSTQARFLDDLHAHFEAVLLPGAAGPGASAAVRTVLAHNDLLSGNILVDEATDEVRFIDYEYGDAGYAGFDVANHFGEYAGFDSNFARGYPDPTTRRDSRRPTSEPGTPRPRRLRPSALFTLVDHLWWGLGRGRPPFPFDFDSWSSPTAVRRTRVPSGMGSGAGHARPAADGLRAGPRSTGKAGIASSGWLSSGSRARRSGSGSGSPRCLVEFEPDRVQQPATPGRTIPRHHVDMQTAQAMRQWSRPTPPG